MKVSLKAAFTGKTWERWGLPPNVISAALGLRSRSLLQEWQADINGRRFRQAASYFGVRLRYFFAGVAATAGVPL